MMRNELKTLQSPLGIQTSQLIQGFKPAIKSPTAEAQSIFENNSKSKYNKLKKLPIQEHQTQPNHMNYEHANEPSRNNNLGNNLSSNTLKS